MPTVISITVSNEIIVDILKNWANFHAEASLRLHPPFDSGRIFRLRACRFLKAPDLEN